MWVVKECTKCKEVKLLDEFYKHPECSFGKTSKCVKCIRKYLQENRGKISEREKKYRQENRGKIKERKKKYRQENREKLKEREKKYYQENKEKISEREKKYLQQNREKIKERRKKYRQENREKISEREKKYRQENKEKRYQYIKERYKSDELFALKSRTRGLIGQAIRSKNYTKKSRTHEILGCSFETFKKHIEKQFQKGMNWDNRDKWHLDHIIPMASATTEEEVLRLNHYTNFQPLWAEDNLKKSDNIIEVQTKLTI